MELKNKARWIFEKIWLMPDENECLAMSTFYAKQCAIMCVKNEYHSTRELLFNLKSSGIDIPGKIYSSRIQGLIDEEKLLIEEIEKL